MVSAKDPEARDEEARAGGAESLVVADVIGNFGLFQLIILLFSTVREGLTAYDSVVTSVILKPVNNYVCAEGRLLSGETWSSSSSSAAAATNRTHQLAEATLSSTETYQTRPASDLDQCHYFGESGQALECTDWLFTIQDHSDKSTLLTTKWRLVCHRVWLLALIETTFLLGNVLGNILWGSLSDKYGPRKTYLLSHLLMLIAGTSSLFLTSYWPFLASRLLLGISSSGYYLLYSILADVIGAKLRSPCSYLQHLGWGLFLILVPTLNGLSSDYRHLLAVSPLVTLITLPVVLWLPESFKWLVSQNKFDQAERVLSEISKFNGVQASEKVNALLDEMKLVQALEEERQATCSALSNFKIIFTNLKLFKNTLILSYVAFLNDLLYFLLTFNFYYTQNLSLEDNFIKSALGEWIGVVFLLLQIKISTRKTCFRLYLSLQMLSFVAKYLIDLEPSSSLNTRWFVVANNGLGCLCAANLLSIVYALLMEVYPTTVRDTGKSIVCSALEMGSSMSPMLIQLGRIIGSEKIDLIVVLMCSLGLLSVNFLAIEEDVELTYN